MNTFSKTIAFACLALSVGTLSAAEGWESYVNKVVMKPSALVGLTPEQVEQRRILLAKRLAARSGNQLMTPADTCAATTNELGALPFNANDTTTGANDDVDLPLFGFAGNGSCTNTSTTCTGGAAGPCTDPQGCFFLGSGTGPDRAFRIQTNANCALSIDLTPSAGNDHVLGVFQGAGGCGNDAANCVCADDTNGDAAPENVVLQAVAGTDYFIVVDTYSSDQFPINTGAFTLAISGACELVPVELQSFQIN